MLSPLAERDEAVLEGVRCFGTRPAYTINSGVGRIEGGWWEGETMNADEIKSQIEDIESNRVWRDLTEEETDELCGLYEQLDSVEG